MPQAPVGKAAKKKAKKQAAEQALAAQAAAAAAAQDDDEGESTSLKLAALLLHTCTWHASGFSACCWCSCSVVGPLT